MGISLQTYRIRIGYFRPYFNTGKNDKPKGNFQYPSGLLSLKSGTVIFVLFNLIALFVYLNRSSFENISTVVQCHPPPPPPLMDISPCTSAATTRQPCTSSCDQYTVQLSPSLTSPGSWLTSAEWSALCKAKFGNRSQKDKGIKIIMWNKGSSLLQNKHHEIQTLIGDHKPHIMGLCEANLNYGVDLSLVQHENYQLHVPRSINNLALGTARVVVYTHSSLIVKRRQDLENDTIPAVWLEIGLPRQKKILLSTMYREWQLPHQADTTSKSIPAQLERWSCFLTMWETALMEGKEVLVMGDMNLDFLKWSNKNLAATDTTVKLKPLIEELFTRIIPHGVSQLVKEGTRVWPGVPTSGLDHVYSNKPEKISDICLEFSGGSDHKLLKFTRFSKSMSRGSKYVRKRTFKNFNTEKFLTAVKELSWLDLYLCENPSKAVELLTKKLGEILDAMAPIRTIQVRTKYAAWLTDQTKALLKDRDKAQFTATQTGDPDDWRYYKNLRNSATSRMRLEKKNWEKSKLDSTHHSSSALWKNIKSWLSWGDSGPPSKLFHNGTIVNKPARVATIMNEFFLSKIVKLQDRIPASNSDPTERLREVLQDRRCIFSLKPVSPEEVFKIMLGLKNSKSTGMDYINTWVIKLVAREILPAVTHIVNISIAKQEFPQSWKIAKVVPLLKKGDPLQPKNYRPVSLLPIFSKILERAIFTQLINYLEGNNLLNPNHHGCRQGHNTATALLQMYDQWLDGVEDDKMVGVMMIDLSAAFDMVDHQILMQKLEMYGLDSQARALMYSYLSGRTQAVMVDGALSPALPLPCGVPQGSILGPLLYILFTNEIPDLVHDHPVSFLDPLPYCSACGATICYVDDSTYSYADKEPAQLSQKLNKQYERVSGFMAANKLVINGDKTHLVVMGTKKTAPRRQEVAIIADGHTVEPSRVETLLGGIICEDMKWKQHLLTCDQSLTRQLTSRLNGLLIVAQHASVSTRLMVANGIFMSKLSYLIQLWGGCDKYLVRSLQIVQNRAARVVTGKSWYTPVRRLLEECRWLSVNQLIFYQTCVQVQKILLGGGPVYFKQKFCTHHPRETRQATGGSIWRGQDWTSSSFSSRGAQAYNTIPADIRNSRSIPTFKSKLKKWVSNNITLY